MAMAGHEAAFFPERPRESGVGYIGNHLKATAFIAPNLRLRRGIDRVLQQVALEIVGSLPDDCTPHTA